MRHFETVKDALAAGYNSATCRALEDYRGYEIRITDTSGSNSFGYSFAVRAAASVELIWTGHGHLGTWGKTVTVWTQDKNMLGQPESFRAMFAPGVLSDAIDMARQAIDTALQQEGKEG